MIEASAPAWAITPQQLAFFQTFGFLRLPGLFAAEADRIDAGFEEVFAEHAAWEMNEELHFDEKRMIIPDFVDKSENLSWLRSDPRVIDTVTSLIGPHVPASSDGNLFFCDTSWHADIFAAPMEFLHVKLSFYLESLSGESGAIRLIPGTHEYLSPFAVALRGMLRTPADVERTLGIAPHEVPCWTLESQPGDVIVWNFRTIHASFYGAQRRRLFSVNFRSTTADEPTPSA